ncbi:MAG: hypothetical protein COA97_04350 [Flavobacteriales bacterium]|nr:MAG: hypothetical protein COA97_04350 [Flavobacteriales bacterium]
MGKTICLIALLTLFGGSAFSQADHLISNSTTAGDRLEATVICLDAIEAPTKYNAYAKEFIDLASFPKKAINLSQDEYRKEINDWLIDNPALVSNILTKKQISNDKLYGPRPHKKEPLK